MITQLEFNGWTHTLKDCFVLAIIPNPPFFGMVRYDLCGLNICIVIERSAEGEEFTEYINKRFTEDFKLCDLSCFLLGDNEERIPFEIHGGNSWGEVGYGKETCCYFGYVHPLMFGSTENGRAYAFHPEEPENEVSHYITREDDV